MKRVIAILLAAGVAGVTTFAAKMPDQKRDKELFGESVTSQLHNFKTSQL